MHTQSKQLDKDKCSISQTDEKGELEVGYREQTSVLMFQYTEQRGQTDSYYHKDESNIYETLKSFSENQLELHCRDLAAHFKPEILTEAMLLEITQNVTNLLVEAFPDTPILPVIGNHDWVCHGFQQCTQTSK